MKIIEWIKEQLKEESYVRNVRLAEDIGYTYQPELYKDCQMRNELRRMNAHDKWMAGGWRDS